MASPSLPSLGVLLGVGIPAFVGAVLLLVFSLVARAAARMRAELEMEGVVLDSGPQWITIRYNNFRSPGLYKGVAITRMRSSLILTQKRLVMTPHRRPYRFIGKKELQHFTAGVAEDGSLQIHSDDPPNACE